jgi:arylsulfatase A-like enzyme
MNFRKRGRTAAASTLAAAAVLSLAGSAPALAGTSRPAQQLFRVFDDRPNVLMITADDAVPRDLRYMPLTRRLLADRGVTFTDAVAPDPICVPARASLLTGQYTHNHKAYTISGDGGGFKSFHSQRTLPVWLQAAGYDTLFLGKYLNGYGDAGTNQLEVEPGWTQWRPTVGGSTYNFMHPTLNFNGHRLVHYNAYNSNLLLQQTKELLSMPRRQRKPWYLWVNYTAPHVGAPVELDDPKAMYPDEPQNWVKTTHPAPRDKGSFADVHLPDTPDMFRTVPDAPSNGAPLTGTQQSMYRLAYEQRLEAVQSLDRAVAGTIRTLSREHMLANTYVVFGSDNGYMVGQHNRYGKLLHYNDSLRIPLIMMGPGVPRGAKVRTAVTNPDVATTIAAIAHARPMRAQDGVDILPWLSRSYRDRVIPLEAYPVRGGTSPAYTGIREGTWTYAHFYHWKGENFEEMYNRATDPFELHNLAGDPAYSRQLRRFRRLDRRYRHCAGATCPKSFVKPARLPLLYGRQRPEN